MRRTVTLALLLWWQQLLVVNTEDIFLSPLRYKEGDSVALIMIQRPDIANSAYTPLMQRTQESCAQPLWVLIPEISFDGGSQKTDLTPAIAGAYAQLLANGLRQSAPVFLAGHGTGATVLQKWTAAHQFDYAKAAGFQHFGGQILLAAFIQRQFRSSQTQLLDTANGYTVKTLTVGGSLDGYCRVSRIAEQHFIQNGDERDTPENAINWPVLVLEGVSHMQFASGPPPAQLQNFDLRPQVSEAYAHTTAAQLLSAFLSAQVTGDASSKRLLSQWLHKTAAFVAPLIIALQFEGFYHFVDPCYCSRQICQSNFDTLPHCLGGNPFNEQFAQKSMAAFPGDCQVKLQVTDSFNRVAEKPVPFSHIWNRCENPQKKSNCVLNATTVTENVYDALDAEDSGVYLTAAVEMRHKMSSRQKSLYYAGYPWYGIEWTDGGDNCRDINQMSYNWALQKSGDAAAILYAQRGEWLRFGEDDVKAAGPYWVGGRLRLNRVPKAGFISVESPSLVTTMDFVVDDLAGVHYCKVLSPARAMEWIYIDSLRLNMSLAPNRPFFDGTSDGSV